MPLRIANAAGFLGDSISAPRRLVESAEVDYLTLEYLAELTMSILARLREKDPAAGYAADFLDVLADLTPALSAQPRLRIITNGGGLNPIGCARAAARVLSAAGLGDVPIGVATGDDLSGRLAELQTAGCAFANLDTGEPLPIAAGDVVCANAYLGARPIAEALAGGARLVITGRVADASLTVGPAVHEFGWVWNDWDRLAGASVAGHLIECGAQATGGLDHRWDQLDLADVGYPIAELAADSTAIITRPAGSGGRIDLETVVGQMVYEIGDPAHYLTPDVDVDFTTVDVDQAAPDRVAVRGATGRAPPDTYKVSLARRAGYTAAGQLLVYGRDCVHKARSAAEMIRRRLARDGCEPAEWYVECLGAGDSVPGLHPPPADLREVVLRVSARDPSRERIERFTREFAPLVTAGPPGLAGYAAGRAPVRPAFAFWPTLVPKSAVSAKVEVRTAAERAKEE